MTSLDRAVDGALALIDEAVKARQGGDSLAAMQAEAKRRIDPVASAKSWIEEVRGRDPKEAARLLRRKAEVVDAEMRRVESRLGRGKSAGPAYEGVTAWQFADARDMLWAAALRIERGDWPEMPKLEPITARPLALSAPEFASVKPAPSCDLIHETPRFWFVWTKRGRTPRKAHDTEAAAVAEAGRLARLHPTRKFIVLEARHKISAAAAFSTGDAA